MELLVNRQNTVASLRKRRKSLQEDYDKLVAAPFHSKRLRDWYERMLSDTDKELARWGKTMDWGF